MKIRGHRSSPFQIGPGSDANLVKVAGDCGANVSHISDWLNSKTHKFNSLLNRTMTRRAENVTRNGELSSIEYHLLAAHHAGQKTLTAPCQE